jgi:phenylacetaldehyde dehydrogenase
MTGGTPTGRAVAAAAGRNLIRAGAELGGKAPVIVFDDADFEAAINGALFASFIAAGQTCIQGSRLLVQDSIAQEFGRRVVEKARTLRLGDPMDPRTQVGPVVSRNQLERIMGYVDVALKEGAELLCGGAQPRESKLQEGYYYLPTILGSVTPGMTVAREEIFGPVIVLMTFHDEQEAIALANDSVFGLGAAVWTRDIGRGHRVAQALEAGIVWVNDHHRLDPSSPWGGMKESGIGRENGWEALWENTESQSIIVNIGTERFDWYGEGEARYS